MRVYFPQVVALNVDTEVIKFWKYFLLLNWTWLAFSLPCFRFFCFQISLIFITISRFCYNFSFIIFLWLCSTYIFFSFRSRAKLKREVPKYKLAMEEKRKKRNREILSFMTFSHSGKFCKPNMKALKRATPSIPLKFGLQNFCFKFDF